jgi:hypothetical protein
MFQPLLRCLHLRQKRVAACLVLAQRASTKLAKAPQVLGRGIYNFCVFFVFSKENRKADRVGGLAGRHQITEVLIQPGRKILLNPPVV